MAAPRQLAEKNQFEIQTIAAPRHLDSKRCVLFFECQLFSGSDGFECTSPSHELIEHGLQRIHLDRGRLENAEILEIGEERKVDCGPHIGHLQLSRHKTEALHRAAPPTEP